MELDDASGVDGMFDLYDNFDHFVSPSDFVTLEPNGSGGSTWTTPN